MKQHVPQNSIHFAEFSANETIKCVPNRDGKSGYTSDISFLSTKRWKEKNHSENIRFKHLSFDSTCYMRLTFPGIILARRQEHRAEQKIKRRRRRNTQPFCPLPSPVRSMYLRHEVAEEKWPATTHSKMKRI